MGNELKKRGELEEGKLAIVIVPEPERSNPFVPFPSSHCPVVWVGVLQNDNIYWVALQLVGRVFVCLLF